MKAGIFVDFWEDTPGAHKLSFLPPGVETFVWWAFIGCILLVMTCSVAVQRPDTVTGDGRILTAAFLFYLPKALGISHHSTRLGNLPFRGWLTVGISFIFLEGLFLWKWRDIHSILSGTGVS